MGDESSKSEAKFMFVYPRLGLSVWCAVWSWYCLARHMRVGFWPLNGPLDPKTRKEQH